MQRYSKQILLKEIGISGQIKLNKSSVLVVGAGGLGSPVLYYLACAGIGKIGIIDYDTVEISNLNRQILHSESDIGIPKVFSAASTLKNINSEIIITPYFTKLKNETDCQNFQQYDVVIDASDNFETRFLINKCCFKYKKPLIEGGVLGMEGFVTPMIPDITHCLSCIYSDIPDINNTGLNTVGILGSVAGIVGTIQATEAIKILLGINTGLLGKLLTINTISMDFRILKWNKKKNCPVCA